MKALLKNSLIIFGVSATLFSLLYLSYVVVRSQQLFDLLQKPRRGWVGDVHACDPRLGFAPRPNSTGTHLFADGTSIPMRYGVDGLRVPVQPSGQELSRPYVLAFGCSFTYGDACYAEETYPYQMARMLGGTALNAGLCSGGLSQMLLRAEELIPKYKPEYVVVQYSHWLFHRSTSYFLDSFQGHLTGPYFTGSGSDLSLAPPVFPSVIFDLPFNAYSGPAANGSFFDFLFDVGLPFYVYEDRQLVFLQLRKALGQVAEPSSDHQAILEHVYGTIARLSKDSGSRMVVVVLGGDQQDVKIPAFFAREGVEVVDAHATLLGRIPAQYRTMDNYFRMYGHVRDGALIDVHPNPTAHRLIAETLVEAVSETKQ